MNFLQASTESMVSGSSGEPAITQAPTLREALVYEAVGPRRCAEAAEFLSRITGYEWTPDFVRWKYFQNPAGEAIVRCWSSRGRIAAMFATLPASIMLGNETVLGLQAVDAMVDPHFRRRGLFAELAGRIFEEVHRGPFALSYSLPNSLATAALIKHAGFTRVGQVPRYSQFLSTSSMRGVPIRKPAMRMASFSVLQYYARLRAFLNPKPDLDIRLGRTTAFDARFDELWNQAAESLTIAVVRDSNYLNYRYVENPARRYLILTAERASRLVGFAVAGLNETDRGKALTVTELLVLPGEAGAGRALLAGLRTFARENQCWQVQCWMLPHHRLQVALLRQSGFVHSSFRFSPGLLRYTTTFIVRPGQLANSGPALEFSNWFLTMGDQDVF